MGLTVSRGAARGARASPAAPSPIEPCFEHRDHMVDLPAREREVDDSPRELLGIDELVLQAVSTNFQSRSRPAAHLASTRSWAGA